MALIKSDRDAARDFNGRTAKFLRNVVRPDPAFEVGGEPQVVVEIDGKEFYFFAGEVKLDDADEAVRTKIKDDLVAAEKAQAARAAAEPTKAEPAEPKAE